MSTAFQIAGGTVMGREHYRLRANRQDAYRIERRGEVTVAVVCDGCGDPDSPHSEVGAALGARMIAHRLAVQLATDDCRLATPEGIGKTLEGVRRETLAGLRKLARSMGDDLVRAISDCLLFTVVGCAINATHAAFFSLGDGVIIVNGQATLLGPYPDNAPPYMAYALLDGCKEQCDLRFSIQHHTSTSALESFLIGSDGVRDLMEQGRQYLPGTNEVVGEIDTFWQAYEYYVNPHALNNRLRLINTDQVRIDWQAHRKATDWGRLADDTTLVVGIRVTHADQDKLHFGLKEFPSEVKFSAPQGAMGRCLKTYLPLKGGSVGGRFIA